MGPGLQPVGDVDPHLFRVKHYIQIVSDTCLQTLPSPSQHVMLLLKLGEVEDAGGGRSFRGQYQLLHGLHDVAEPLAGGVAQP
ncbi:hypothetical protein D3C78_661420 [compost metagenome]